MVPLGPVQADEETGRAPPARAAIPGFYAPAGQETGALIKPFLLYLMYYLPAFLCRYCDKV